MSKGEFRTLSKTFAWAVHGFTSLGLVLGFMAILAVNQSDYRLAMFYLVCAGFIDGIDGTFARLIKVKEVLPNMDGSMIDVVVDFVNYAVVPTYMIYHANVLPDGLGIYLAGLILLTSALYYGKKGMVYQEKFFIGFPVLWNIIAFYIIFIFSWSPYSNMIFIIIFAILHFVPLKYSYPSRRSRFQYLDLAMSGIFLIIMLCTIYTYPEKEFIFNISSIVLGVYFMIMAIFNTLVSKGEGN